MVQGCGILKVVVVADTILVNAFVAFRSVSYAIGPVRALRVTIVGLTAITAIAVLRVIFIPSTPVQIVRPRSRYSKKIGVAVYGIDTRILECTRQARECGRSR